MLAGCEQSSQPGRQIRLAEQGLLSADLAGSGKLALVSSLGQGTVVWDLDQGRSAGAGARATIGKSSSP